MTDSTRIAPKKAVELIAQDSTVDSSNGMSSAEDEMIYVLKTQIIEGLKENVERRRQYAKRTFILTVIWITLVIIIVLFSGIEGCLKLSDTVIVTLITTTTINVFGFFLLVMKYLFNTREITELKELFIKKP